MHRFICPVVLTLAITAPLRGQGPATPTALAATSATRSAIALAWTAPDPGATRFIVERKPLGASWTPPAPPAGSPIVATTVTGVTMTDTAIGALGTYVYRVRVAGPSDTPGPPSSEITVGPPPVGFSQVAAQPANLLEPQQFARGVSIAPDANSDPAIAYLHFDPDNNNDNSDSTLNFISWNRARYRWNTPVRVAVTGDTETNSPRFGISLAYDAARHRFGIAHMTGTREVRLAQSDDGVTWTDAGVAMAPEGTAFGEPSLAMDKGRAFLVYAGDNGAVTFVSGALSDSPDKWSSENAPLLPDTLEPRRPGLQVALDAAGRPAVIYWLTPMNGYNMTLALWRPGTKAAVKVVDTNGEQSDGVDSRLAFKGQRATVALYAHRDQAFFDNRHQIWIMSSSDNGATWGAPAPLPSDGGNSVGTPIALALDSQGAPAIVAPVDGGNSEGSKCGRPKLFRQSVGVWTVCAPDTKGSPLRGVVQPQAIFAANDQLYIVFKGEDDAGSGFKSGLMLWRER